MKETVKYILKVSNVDETQRREVEIEVPKWQHPLSPEFKLAWTLHLMDKNTIHSDEIIDEWTLA